VLEVVADLVGVPAGAVEEPLKAVGGAVSGVFGQLPAVLAADRAQVHGCSHASGDAARRV